MKIIGLIAEYNPFHYGHLYQIREIKKKFPNSIIIAIISPTFTQRGDVSVLNKWDKTKICLDNGIDIVLELPTMFAIQAADIFARESIKILAKFKIDTLVFGTENEDINKLKKIANIFSNNNFNDDVKKNLNLGLNYPTALSKTIKDKLGFTVDSPNDILSISYLKELKKYNIKPYNIKRNTNYHGNDIKGNITSATNIREMILNHNDIAPYIPGYNKDIIYNISKENLFPYLKYKILVNINKLDNYHLVNEGLENRIKKYVISATSWDKLSLNIKTKRYTYNKINRILLNILLDFTKEESKLNNSNYIRLLGFSQMGRNYLNKIKKKVNTPIITNYKKNLSPILDFEIRATYIYSLITDINLIELEYKSTPIIKKL